MALPKIVDWAEEACRFTGYEVYALKRSHWTYLSGKQSGEGVGIRSLGRRLELGRESMRLAESAAHGEIWDVLAQQGLEGVAEEALDAPRIEITPASSGEIRDHIQRYLQSHGWASPVKLDPTLGPALAAMHSSGVVFHVQTGNVARAFYDLMKIQSLFHQNRVLGGILVVPSSQAARIIGGNLANFDRVSEELRFLFQAQISVPLLLAGFD